MSILFKTGMFVVGLLLSVIGLSEAQSNIHSAEKQIKAAVSPAPEDLQAGAEVMGYDKNGNLITLREGTNQLICIADDPEQKNFHVACYHEDLEPFMKRGRELQAKGFSRKKVDSLRRKEIEKGEIDLPRKPMALYSLTGSENAFDFSTGQVINASPLYVVYIPFATQETTGLSRKPASKGAPWIMEPGTPWAHIMVMTGRDLGSGEVGKSGY
jgi:hypothetical protein